MSFKRIPQVFNNPINTVELGVGEEKIEIGGETTFPLFTFDASTKVTPKIGVEITDLGESASTPAQMAIRASEMDGADFICLRLEGADPNGANKSVEECVQVAVDVSNACAKPIVVTGCGNFDKDATLFEKIAEALSGKNVLFLSAREENYKKVGAAVGLAYGQKVGAESSVDINLAKQLNVVLTQLGVNAANVVMNLGAAAAGYGFEYLISTVERVKSAALAQNDAMLQMPVITPVASETWSVKESIFPESEMPEWGPAEERGIHMEVSTAAACLAAGSNAVILKHPRSVETISRLIRELM